MTYLSSVHFGGAGHLKYIEVILYVENAAGKTKKPNSRKTLIPGRANGTGTYNSVPRGQFSGEVVREKRRRHAYYVAAQHCI